ncbi:MULTISPECIES: hypothetical protein [Hyphomonas]|uniref:Uncharacterized protein n=1 Tax=Hyphomonas atlantica TaxID=1280948 RepID=A0A059DZ87_9PROT|nr:MULTISPECIES: hypothetical protein [Hyphomonas]KCZ59236.1 hypothetical protein HY36_08130 [Hyphomonas atlantica]
MTGLYTFMNEVNPSLARTRSMMNLATQTSVIGTYRDQPKTDTHGVNKWPVWLRILVIVSLSSALWTGIIAGVAAIL